MDRESVLTILDGITTQYEADAMEHYRPSKEKKKPSSGPPPRFNFSALSRKIFDKIPANQLPELYILLLSLCDEYILAKGQDRFGIPNILASMLPLSELVISIIIPYQLPQAKRTSQLTANEKKSKAYKSVGPRIQLKVEDAKHLLPYILPINLYSESKLWKQIRYILVPDGKNAKLAELTPVIAQALENGTISFAALTFCMQDPTLSVELPPSAIIFAAYLGPLKSSCVEMFACNRSSEFRATCRELIETLETAVNSPSTWLQYRPLALPPATQWTFRHFSESTTRLVNEMKGVTKPFAPIAMNWACAAIKKFGKRTYVDKTWHEENLYDLIWTVLVQRPSLKKFICETLENDFHDYGAAKYWRRMVPHQMDRVHIRNRNVEEIDLFGDAVEYLNFPHQVSEISVIDDIPKLQYVIAYINNNLDIHGEIIAGLDAEWSAFTGDSKATILQIAFPDRIFILDLDAEAIHDDLRAFFRMLFLEKRIMKIGFQFSEDLLQIRSAITHCGALYRPENLICVGRLIADLLDETERREDKDAIIAEICPSLAEIRREGEDLNDSINGDESNKDKDTSNISTRSDTSESLMAKVINKGLSYLCEQILGRPLDKTEQCSVWDRRPLRSLQIRYASMDAYCLLLLFDSCDRWAKRMDMSISDFIKKQSPHRCSLPLFSDDL